MADCSILILGMCSVISSAFEASAPVENGPKLVLTPEMMFLINKTKVVEKRFIFDDAGTSDAMKLHDGFAERCQALLDVLNRPGSRGVIVTDAQGTGARRLARDHGRIPGVAAASRDVVGIEI